MIHMNDIKKILIVEDDLFLRDIYIETLSTEKFKVEAAKNKEETLTALQKNKYDLILMDVLMDGVSGFELAKHLRSQNIIDNSTRLVFFTNLDDEESRKKAVELRAGFMLKSDSTPDVLEEKITRILADVN